jgi:phosphatidylinositol kinase/protein kinase (PI-3  family)
VEGVFRCSMELCLSVLREHKDVCLSILEPFLRDPTVAWKRSGRAQRVEGSSSARTVGVQEQENTEAKAALSTISERLSGVYNVQHPNSEAIQRAHAARAAAVAGSSNSNIAAAASRPARGVGAIRREELPMSVEGQVQRLIDEAVAEENLAQMFLGKTMNIRFF